MSRSIEDRLAGERPMPPAGFRGELRRALLAKRPGPHRPPNLWAMVALAAGLGLVLLAIALALAL